MHFANHLEFTLKYFSLPHGTYIIFIVSIPLIPMGWSGNQFHGDALQFSFSCSVAIHNIEPHVYAFMLCRYPKRLSFHHRLCYRSYLRTEVCQPFNRSFHRENTLLITSCAINHRELQQHLSTQVRSKQL